MSPEAENVIERLDGARQKWWLFSLLTTTVLAACLSFAIFLAMMLTDSLAMLPQPWLLGLFVAWLLVTGTLILAVGRRLLRGQRSLEAMARRVECEFPELGSDLINLVQLSEERATADRAFRETAVNQAAIALDGVTFDRAAAREPRWRRFAHCMQTPRDLAESLVILALLIAVAMFCAARLPNWGSAASRLLAPWRFIPSIGSVEILRVTPGDAEVLLGESVEVAAEINNPNGTPHRASLIVMPTHGQQTSQPMIADEKHRRYKLTVPALVEAMNYRLEIGDSQTPVYRIEVRAKPAIESAEMVFRYPAYLGRKSETVRGASLDIEAPAYTVVELRLRPTAPVAKGYLESAGEQFVGHVEGDGKLLVATMPLLKSGSYLIHLFDDAGHTDHDPRPNRITVFPDQPPTVELLKPSRQSTAAPGTDVPVVIRAGDDHGLGGLRLEMKTGSSGSSDDGQGEGGGDSPTTVVKQWTDFAGDATTAVRRYHLALRPESVKPGQTVLVRAVAFDRRSISDWGLDLKPQQAASDWHAIKIVAEEAEAAALLEQLESLRAAIWKLLEKQIASRVAAAALLKKEPVEELNKAVAGVRGRQIDIQKTTVALVPTVQPAERPERMAIKRALSVLAVGEMLQAVVLCDELEKQHRIEPPEDRLAAAGTATKLTALQDRIIDVLRKLLEVIRHAQAQLLAEMKHRVEASLPNDEKQKCETARDKLDKFIAEQKKVIEASENLAKKPVEDFTAEDEALLKKLAAAEDDWSKFMVELQSDLSKLPDQDFANPTTAKEFVEIQTELKMAADALLKKSIDIAVPLEQLGYERAEDLKTNIEKWLPDTPDREKWSQEEPLTDKDKEAPMAELPGELEDMVGDLMEQEEDLFDEMEDVSSSAADSLDKGAGWDTLDGPISNNGAKGVTGNRLPNSSEIGGRSGEGREGNSSGEFVGDEAVGKGGRRTPSRLTPDPYVKGRIDDRSRQPSGGATGGGKQSGVGGEGLEGSVPRQASRADAQRLAGRQAQLRNKAEGIDLRLQVVNFHHIDLAKMIEIMAQVERDLKAGRYQNALRERHVLLESLGNVKRYLAGDVEIRRDATANLPADIQKKILGSMQDPSPPGWEELNRQYFERLSGDDDLPTAEKTKPAKGRED